MKPVPETGFETGFEPGTESRLYQSPSACARKTPRQHVLRQSLLRQSLPHLALAALLSCPGQHLSWQSGLLGCRWSMEWSGSGREGGVSGWQVMNVDVDILVTLYFLIRTVFKL